MNTAFLIRTVLTFLFAVTLSLTLRYNLKSGDDSENPEQPRYLPFFSCGPSLFILVYLPTYIMIEFGFMSAPYLLGSMFFSVFLHIGLYYMILLPVMPFLRKRISAQACAMLWMIPNSLYITQIIHTNRPLIILPVPKQLTFSLLTVWLAGFVGVLGWKAISHLIFRRRILKHAKPVTSPTILQVWQQELDYTRMKKANYKLVLSTAVSSPLTVGLFRSTIRVVLPRENYTPEELSLIFRHELVHISRNDTRSKFALAFCTATCWFNPLMWVAMKKNAEDLELSCDETVLWGKDEEERKLYARLILDTAGESAGFTTCLSAAASSLRYRLKHIVKPRAVRSGALTVGIIFFALYMSCGYVALAYESGSGKDTLFMGYDPEIYTLVHVSDSNSSVLSPSGEMVCTDPQGLIAYLASLKTDRITGAMLPEEGGRGIRIQLDGPDGRIGASLSSNYITMVDFTKDGYPTFFYSLPDGVNWDYLDSILPVYPTLTVYHTPPEHQFSHQTGVTASQLIRLTTTENETQTILKQWDPTDHFLSSYFSSLPEQAALEFSHPLIQPFRIEVENWDGSHSYTIQQDERFPSKIVTLPAYPARYTVYATLDGGNGIVYEAQFRFQFAYLDMDERYAHHTESEG